MSFRLAPGLRVVCSAFIQEPFIFLPRAAFTFLRCTMHLSLETSVPPNAFKQQHGKMHLNRGWGSSRLERVAQK